MPADTDEPEPGNLDATPAQSPGRHRRHSSPPRDQRTFARFTTNEYADLVAAAARIGLTTTGYVADAAVAATRGVTPDGQQDDYGITRAELAQLQRDLFAARTALNRAAVNLDHLAAAPAGTRLDNEITARAQSAARSTRSPPTSTGGCGDRRHQPTRAAGGHADPESAPSRRRP